MIESEHEIDLKAEIESQTVVLVSVGTAAAVFTCFSVSLSRSGYHAISDLLV